ncbi:hypothetical protein [uncultured Prochlorococcus sp.]|uniref:hypothetical protein n=1 Tax=uncultured Prochlorococcus sp. TaxID=159733 RepID=UPI00258F2EAA|nr:hypothetical protein [uncultured Prochlorococcus sp.]
MNKLFLKDYIIAGGLMDLNIENIKLREIQIRDGLFIHTCNDYDKSLEVIKEASFNLKNQVKIISKIYFNYPDIKHRRFRSLFSQIKEQRERLGFVPSEWNLQICCYCPLNKLISKNAQKFFRKINFEFGINKIFLEIYPIYNFNIEKIQILNNFYEGEVIFGVSSYQNYLNRSFMDSDLQEFSKNHTNIIFIGILGKGIQNKNFPRTFNADFLNKNIVYFLNNININKFSRGITNFSSIRQYENFNEVFFNLQKNIKRYDLGKSLDLEYKKKIFYFKNFDQYGGIYSTKQYLLKPKLILHKIKNLIYKYKNFREIANNFFG